MNGNCIAKVPKQRSNGRKIRAIIHVIGIYCGVPQSLECFRSARKVLTEAGLLEAQ